VCTLNSKECILNEHDCKSKNLVSSSVWWLSTATLSVVLSATTLTTSGTTTSVTATTSPSTRTICWTGSIFEQLRKSVVQGCCWFLLFQSIADDIDFTASTSKNGPSFLSRGLFEVEFLVRVIWCQITWDQTHPDGPRLLNFTATSPRAIFLFRFWIFPPARRWFWTDWFLFLWLAAGWALFRPLTMEFLNG